MDFKVDQTLHNVVIALMVTHLGQSESILEGQKHHWSHSLILISVSESAASDAITVSKWGSATGPALVEVSHQLAAIFDTSGFGARRQLSVAPMLGPVLTITPRPMSPVSRSQSPYSIDPRRLLDPQQALLHQSWSGSSVAPVIPEEGPLNSLAGRLRPAFPPSPTPTTIPLASPQQSPQGPNLRLPLVNIRDPLPLAFPPPESHTPPGAGSAWLNASQQPLHARAENNRLEPMQRNARPEQALLAPRSVSASSQSGSQPRRFPQSTVDGANGGLVGEVEHYLDARLREMEVSIAERVHGLLQPCYERLEQIANTQATIMKLLGSREGLPASPVRRNSSFQDNNTSKISDTPARNSVETMGDLHSQIVATESQMASVLPHGATVPAIMLTSPSRPKGPSLFERELYEEDSSVLLEAGHTLPPGEFASSEDIVPHTDTADSHSPPGRAAAEPPMPLLLIDPESEPEPARS